VLSHAHFDHAGCSAWLCRTFDLPLWCGAGDATAITSGRVDTHRAPLANFGLHPSRPRLVLAPAALSSDDDQNRRSAARLAALRPRLACFGHGFAVTDPGQFAATIFQLLSATS
jgi:Metallo-beta-lactamase superfamily